MLDQLPSVAPSPTRAAIGRIRCQAAMAKRLRADARRQALRRSASVVLVVAIPIVFLLAIVRDLLVFRLWR